MSERLLYAQADGCRDLSYIGTRYYRPKVLRPFAGGPARTWGGAAGIGAFTATDARKVTVDATEP